MISPKPFTGLNYLGVALVIARTDSGMKRRVGTNSPLHWTRQAYRPNLFFSTDEASFPTCTLSLRVRTLCSSALITSSQGPLDAGHIGCHDEL